MLLAAILASFLTLSQSFSLSVAAAVAVVLSAPDLIHPPLAAKAVRGSVLGDDGGLLALSSLAFRRGRMLLKAEVDTAAVGGELAVDAAAALEDAAAAAAAAAATEYGLKRCCRSRSAAAMEDIRFEFR